MLFQCNNAVLNSQLYASSLKGNCCDVSTYVTVLVNCSQLARPDVLGVDTRPANALTLDEIQARENIHTPLSHPGDQSAFNKLVAQLQFTGAIHQEEKSPAVSMRVLLP